MTLRILLADSSIATQTQGAKVLAAAGHDVVTVSNGVAAFKRIAEAQFDLALLDVYLPGAGGVEVCEKIKMRSALAQISVLLTAGRMDPFSAEQAIKVRADGFMLKPFEASRLIPIVEKLALRVRPHDTASASPRLRKSEPSRLGLGGAADSTVQSGSRTGMITVPGRSAGEICDVCGCVNDQGAFACQRCDIPLPGSVTAFAQRVRRVQ